MLNSTEICSLIKKVFIKSIINKADWFLITVTQVLKILGEESW